MAIKNTLLGGDDWEEYDLFTSQDLNDTFNAAVNKIQTLTAFWLNDELYDIYDDFESYSVGTLPTTKWTITGSPQVVSSTNTGGAGKECRISNEQKIETSAFSANKHMYCKLYISKVSVSGSGTVNGYCNITFGGTTVQVALWNGPNNAITGNTLSNILIIALGDDDYDVYFGGKKIISNVHDTTPSLLIEAFSRYTADDTNAPSLLYVYIDDVVQSKGIVS